MLATRAQPVGRGAWSLILGRAQGIAPPSVACRSRYSFPTIPSCWWVPRSCCSRSCSGCSPRRVTGWREPRRKWEMAAAVGINSDRINIDVAFDLPWRVRQEPSCASGWRDATIGQAYIARAFMTVIVGGRRPYRHSSGFGAVGRSETSCPTSPLHSSARARCWFWRSMLRVLPPDSPAAGSASYDSGERVDANGCAQVADCPAYSGSSVSP
jgi:hypothetical protein